MPSASSLCLPARQTTYGQQYCVESSEVYQFNSRRGMATLPGSGSQSCVQVDNSAKIDKYHVLVASVDPSQVSAREAAAVAYNKLLAFQSAASTATYAPGQAISQLNLPAADQYGLCVDGSVLFLVNSDRQCSQAGRLQDLCMGVLSVSRFTSGAKVAGVVYRDSSTLAENSLSSYATNYGENQCTQAVIEAHYVVITGQTQNSVGSVSVSLVVTTISASDVVKVPQKISVRFYTTANYAVHSGNPGYMTSMPLIVAYNFKSTGNFYFSGKISSGVCSTTPSSGPVLNFGSNFVYSCSKAFTLQALKQYCSSSLKIENENIFANVNKIVKIGKWGNSQQSTYNNSDGGDWVNVEKSQAGSATMNGTICTLANVMVLDVYYAFIGALDNPQPKVVYATSYYNMGKWQFNRPNAGDSQNFLLSVTVNYIPYDTAYDPYSEKMRKDTIMPQPVLYPFRSADAQTLFALFFISML
jgi:hypothetical protein